jgi:hypothetical protein
MQRFMHGVAHHAFCRQLKKVKKANGEIIGVNVVCSTLAAIQEADVWAIFLCAESGPAL